MCTGTRLAQKQPEAMVAAAAPPPLPPPHVTLRHLRRERREARRRVLELRQAGKDLVAAGVNLWSRRANLVRDQLLEAMRQYRLLSKEIRIWQCYL